MITLSPAASAVEPTTASPVAPAPGGAVAHGTRACYQHGCRRPECKVAEAAYRAQLRREPTRRVPAGIVRAHVAELTDQGYSLGEIARMASVSATTVQAIARGAKRCHIDVERALLNVLPTRTGNDKGVVPPKDDVALGILIALIRPPELAWRAEGTCANLDMAVERRQVLYFPRRGRDVTRALSLCNGDANRPECPVRRQCFALAMDTSTTIGIFGGTTGAERRAMKAALVAVTTWQEGLRRGH